MNDFALSDMQRRLANLIRVGEISALDETERKIRVSFGSITTAWLDWPATYGRNYRRWRPLRMGQQVIMASPSGELAQAKIVGFLYRDTIQPPSENPDLDVIEFDDGTVLQYDSASHKLTATVKGAAEITTDGDVTATVGGGLTVDVTNDINATAGGSATVKAPTITLDGNVTITGSLTQGTNGADANFGGTVEAATDVTTNGVSLKTHTHTGVTSGTSTSGPPA